MSIAFFPQLFNNGIEIEVKITISKLYLNVAVVNNLLPLSGMWEHTTAEKNDLQCE
jgi:hypothetical protein